MYKDNNELVSFTATGGRRSSISTNSKDMIWFSRRVTQENMTWLIHTWVQGANTDQPESNKSPYSLASTEDSTQHIYRRG